MDLSWQGQRKPRRIEHVRLVITLTTAFCDIIEAEPPRYMVCNLKQDGERRSMAKSTRTNFTQPCMRNAAERISAILAA